MLIQYISCCLFVPTNHIALTEQDIVQYRLAIYQVIIVFPSADTSKSQTSDRIIISSYLHLTKFLIHLAHERNAWTYGPLIMQSKGDI